MAKPRKVGKRWRIEIQVRGQKLSTYHPDKQAAMAWAIEQQAVRSGEGFVAGRTMRMLFERYAREVLAGRKGERHDTIRLGVLTRRFGNITVMGLSSADIEAWRDERLGEVKGSSVNRDLTLLSAALSRAVRWRWRADNPCKLVDRPANPPPRTRIFTDAEVAVLLAAMRFDPDDPQPPTTRMHETGYVAALSLATCMRIGEITGLRWEHVHLVEKFCYLPTTKNGADRRVSLSTDARRYLEALGPRESGPVLGLSRDVASNYFRKARVAAGMTSGTAHDCRRTAITRYSRVLTPFELARLAGQNIEMTLRYYNASATEIADRLG